MDSLDVSEVYERIKLATNAQNATSLAAKLGISSQAVSNQLKLSKIPKSWIVTLSSKYGISSDWLLYGKGTMKLDSHDEESFLKSQKVNQNISNFNEDFILIPLVEACLSAGGGSFETSSVIAKEYAFRKDFIQSKGNPDNMVLMRVSGDSMEPEVYDNDMVLIDQSRTNILAGKIYAVSFEDCIYLKRIDLLPGKVILKSVNPAYLPVELSIQGDMESLFRVIGKVLWVGREYN